MFISRIKVYNFYITIYDSPPLFSSLKGKVKVTLFFDDKILIKNEMKVKRKLNC